MVNVHRVSSRRGCQRGGGTACSRARPSRGSAPAATEALWHSAETAKSAHAGVLRDNRSITCLPLSGTGIYEFSDRNFETAEKFQDLIGKPSQTSNPIRLPLLLRLRLLLLLLLLCASLELRVERAVSGEPGLSGMGGASRAAPRALPPRAMPHALPPRAPRELRNCIPSLRLMRSPSRLPLLLLLLRTVSSLLQSLLVVLSSSAALSSSPTEPLGGGLS